MNALAAQLKVEDPTSIPRMTLLQGGGLILKKQYKLDTQFPRSSIDRVDCLELWNYRIDAGKAGGNMRGGGTTVSEPRGARTNVEFSSGRQNSPQSGSGLQQRGSAAGRSGCSEPGPSGKSL